MKVFIAGIDGYLGWPLAMHLSQRGHQVSGCDTLVRRKWVAEMGSVSAIPIADLPRRQTLFKAAFNHHLDIHLLDLTNYHRIAEVLKNVEPDVIVHFAEMPSAPYSMVDFEHCVYTHTNNINGTLVLLHAMRDVCPNAHLLKLGTMGEYGTPNVDIPEGYFDIEYRGRREVLPFPRQAGSWYHQTKVHDSHNIMLACRIWGLKSTDIMQGVVYGSADIMDEYPELATRFDFDQCFGTAINRFCMQAVLGIPITPYGKGKQKRGFIPLKDSMQCLTLAAENPPEDGEYRVFNQFEEVYDVTTLANIVAKAAKKLGQSVEIRNLTNPRKEQEDHYYNPDHRRLLELGYEPTTDIAAEVRTTLARLLPYREQLEAYKDVVIPDIRWDGTTRRSEYLPTS